MTPIRSINSLLPDSNFDSLTVYWQIESIFDGTIH
ncbi:hypothetical protein DK59_2969 [Brucella abortus bv. 4 str. 292]|nr:hypothetical protein DK66_640 [Brucella suis 1330]KFJ51476.1 hypothetical protein DK47_1590 [Brucella abortus 2308]KFJ63125.1 hypothetical protein DK59_2969 [Brucella abortus bv. 4 str. 292]